MTVDLLSTDEVAKQLKVGVNYVHRRVVHAAHPEYIPNVKLGRKRYVHPAVLQQWLEEKYHAMKRATT